MIERRVEIPTKAGRMHAFICSAFPGRPACNRDAAERQWERLFALFKGTLKE